MHCVVVDPSEDFELESVSDDEEDIIEEDDDDTENNDLEADPNKKSIFAGRRKAPKENEVHETIIDRAGQVTEGITKVFTGAVDVTNQGINKVVGATTDLVVTAASKAPVLKNIVKPHVHRYV